MQKREPSGLKLWVFRLIWLGGLGFRMELESVNAQLSIACLCKKNKEILIVYMWSGERQRNIYIYVFM
ncbi:hypothetical protein Hanom_Chr07g00652751 [Helianthus anomalus]